MLADVLRVMKGQAVTTKIKKIVPRRRFLVLGGGALTLVLLVALAFSLKSPTMTSNFQVPNVVGLTEQQARDILGDYTITVQHAPDSRIPKDRIASQLPLATTKVQRGSSVTLTVSDGPGNTTVPIDLVGMTLSDARNSLTAAGLLVTQTVPVDSNSAPGVILKVTPDPGSIIPAGSGVILQIASGSLQVPQLVGLSEIEAQTILTQAGFLVKPIFGTDAGQPNGVVLAQAPTSGTTQTIGSSVTITINKIN
jgi:serine/threonine-protein kinase